jgi:hypothetical protein
MLRDDLRLYIRQAWHVVEPSTIYLENWHIDLIAEYLEAVTAGQIKRDRPFRRNLSDIVFAKKRNSVSPPCPRAPQVRAHVSTPRVRDGSAPEQADRYRGRTVTDWLRRTIKLSVAVERHQVDGLLLGLIFARGWLAL